MSDPTLTEAQSEALRKWWLAPHHRPTPLADLAHQGMCEL